MKTPRARKFDEVSELYGQLWRRMAVVHCRICGVEDRMAIKASLSLLPDEVINKRFLQRGWSIGANAHWDICPACRNHRQLKSQQPDTQHKR